MEWEKQFENTILPVKSWCADLEQNALDQILNLANHPVLFSHVAIMPDCHSGYGMPIGGVIACNNAVIPNAVGVDIGCGMGAVKTNLKSSDICEKSMLRDILERIKSQIPVGEGRGHKKPQCWDRLDRFLLEYRNGFSEYSGWLTKHCIELAYRNLGSLGGGNHFIELQVDEDDDVWIMLHSGSRNLGYKIAEYFNLLAGDLLAAQGIQDCFDLAYLQADSVEGEAYIEAMNFALEYAFENRSRMMASVKNVLGDLFKYIEFTEEVNIHHNYASLEEHFGSKCWIHRKGATSAKADEIGIIPGSMGTHSFIVRGLGNSESFMSCSHGAGRVMSRTAASRKLSQEECDLAMDGIVFDRWKRVKRGSAKGMLDLGEAPGAYKDIDGVISAEDDLVETLVRLRPLMVVKG